MIQDDYSGTDEEDNMFKKVWENELSWYLILWLNSSQN